MVRSLGIGWRVAVVFVLLSSGRNSVAQAVESWPHDPNYVATLFTRHDIVVVEGKLTSVEFDGGEVVGFSDRAVFGGTTVQFGPFQALNNGGFEGHGAGVASTFTVTILARTPLSLNPGQAMTTIGQGQVTVQPGQQTTFYVFATLPAALSAIDIAWSAGTAARRVTPEDCGSGASDANCLQAAINPVGMVLAMAPVSILYEPPGNCSYASVTANSVQGTSISIDQMSSEDNGTLTTIQTPEGATTSNNVIFSKTSTSTKSNQLQLATGVTIYTSQGGSSPPPNCANRVTGGPGHGDVFAMLDNAPFVYWNTGNLSNSRSRNITGDASTTEPFPPGQMATEYVTFTADDLRNNPGILPGTLAGRSQADRDAILGLDPLVTLSPANPSGAATTAPFVPLPLPRYVAIPSLLSARPPV